MLNKWYSSSPWLLKMFLEELVRIPAAHVVDDVVNVVWSKSDEGWRRKRGEEGGENGLSCRCSTGRRVSVDRSTSE
jgi:hypothetical protein